MADRITYVGLDVHKERIVVAVAEAGCGARYASMAGSRTRRRRWSVGCASCGGGHDPAVLLRSGAVRLWHSTATVAARARMRRGRALADPAQAGRPGQDRPAGCRQPGQAAPGGRADGGVGSGCPAQRRCAIWCGRGSTRCTPCAGRASSSPDSCCARAATTAGRPGPSCIAAGWRVSSSSRRCITSCSRTTSRRSKLPTARRDRLTAQIEAMLPDWSLAPVVAALQTMRGMALVNAATLIAELGDLSRFANPRQLMAYLGLVPSEHSSGAAASGRRSPRPATARPAGCLIEAAWSYRFPARISRELLLRQESQPKPIRDIAWKAQVRLCARYRRLARTGKPANVVTTAIARELAGFVWAIARQVSRRQADRERVNTSKGGATASTPSEAGQGWGHGRGQENPRIHYLPDPDPTQAARPRQLRDASTVMRFRPAHQSMINRRFTTAPPALPSSGHANSLTSKPRNSSPAS